VSARDAPLLRVENLSVGLEDGRRIVQDVSFTLAAGETFGLVGESGSGKTTTALALLGYARRGMRVTSGDVELRGEKVSLHDERAARKLRGRIVAHVPQDPATNLNPSLRIGQSVADVFRAHRPDDDVQTAVRRVLERVHLPSTGDFLRRYPHQLSGGQQQRVLIACALVCEPALLVLDEPTTGLDVVTQAHILDEIKQLHRERDLAMIYVSHDLAVISQIAERVAVMYGGLIVEEGPTSEVLARPRHPYTLGLASSIPDHTILHRRLHGIPGVAVGGVQAGCPFEPRCAQRVDRCRTETPSLERVGTSAARCFESHRTPALAVAESLAAGGRAGAPVLSVEDLHAVHGRHGRTVVAANAVSFTVGRGECVALVGESGSGKTTIARTIAGLHKPAAGRLLLADTPLSPSARNRPRELRRRCQIIFQNPYESLNPSRRVIDEVMRPAFTLRRLPKTQAREEARDLLSRVRLPAHLAEKYPVELSGGERQRVAIARALIAQPDVVVCDEITSALDVSVQAAVIELLVELREELGLSLLFITHNLGVVASIADRVLILEQGRICEEGTLDEVFVTPRNAYTAELLAAAPRLTASQGEPIHLSGESV
jgi:peptide/nickel transport system ATP-binding protein